MDVTNQHTVERIAELAKRHDLAMAEDDWDTIDVIEDEINELPNTTIQIDDCEWLRDIETIDDTLKKLNLDAIVGRFQIGPYIVWTRID